MCIGIPGEVLSIEGEDLLRSAQVRFPQGEQNVSLACLPDVEVGEYVIVHAGIALSSMDEETALSIMDDLRQIASALPEATPPDAREDAEDKTAEGGS